MICPILTFCQTTHSDSSGISISPGALSRLDAAYAGMDATLNTRTRQLLQQMQKSESRLLALLQRKDSIRARQLFSNTTAMLLSLQAKGEASGSDPLSALRHYVPGIDSMQTAVSFLSGAGLSAGKLQQLQVLGSRLKQLQTGFQDAGEIQDYVTARMSLLQAQLSAYGITRPLASLSKAAFYYQQQVAQYKNILNNRQQQQQLVLGAVRRLPAFQQYWQQHSMLSQLMPPPANSGTLLSGNGLQTGTEIGKNIQHRLGTDPGDSGTSAVQYLQRQIVGAQGQMDQLKQKLDMLHLPGGSSDMVLPDLTPNSQQQKSFKQRLEFVFNIQNTASTPLLPAISTLGLSVGYRLSDKCTAGAGVSYLLGLGSGFNHIRFSNEGIGLRSFVDVKAIKGIWVTGGFEYTYLQQFSGLKDIDNLDLWQKSILLGLTKKLSMGKHTGNIQLLYDFLAGQEIPRGQPLKFRLGYSL